MENENRGKKWERPKLTIISTCGINENVLDPLSGGNPRGGPPGPDVPPQN